MEERIQDVTFTVVAFGAVLFNIVETILIVTVIKRKNVDRLLLSLAFSDALIGIVCLGFNLCKFARASLLEWLSMDITGGVLGLSVVFSLLLKHAFGTATEGLYLHTRLDGRLFNLARLRAKTKVCKITVRDLLFADDAAITIHTIQDLQILMDRFSEPCKDFGLTISLKKTDVLAQGMETPPVTTIDNYELGVVHQFTYLGCTITDNLSLDVEVNRRIGKAATTLGGTPNVAWRTPSCQPRPRWQCSMPASSTLICMAVRHGQHMQNRSRD